MNQGFLNNNQLLQNSSLQVIAGHSNMKLIPLSIRSKLLPFTNLTNVIPKFPPNYFKSTQTLKIGAKKSPPKIPEATKFKIEMCKNWETQGWCTFGDKCTFAHGKNELVDKSFVIPKYKSRKCESYYFNGFCNFGPKCNYLHSLSKDDHALYEGLNTLQLSIIDDNTKSLFYYLVQGLKNSTFDLNVKDLLLFTSRKGYSSKRLKVFTDLTKVNFINIPNFDLIKLTFNVLDESLEFLIKSYIKEKSINSVKSELLDFCILCSKFSQMNLEYTEVCRNPRIKKIESTTSQENKYSFNDKDYEEFLMYINDKGIDKYAEFFKQGKIFLGL